jgi:predicted AAA+ superfamily ATPase
MELERIYKEKLISEIKNPYISILIGPRQVGKSYLLRQIQKECRKMGYSTAFYNLEFSDDLMKFSADEKIIIDMINNGPDVVFIDEFHYLRNATKIFKAVYDSGRKKKIFASGSSSVEMHKHLKESLAGRFRISEIYPLTLKELAKIRGYNINDYFSTGGMPGLIHEKTLDEKIELLKNIVHTYLMKDIKSLIREENIRSFNHLLYSIAGAQGSIATVAGFARDVRLSEPAVNNHLDILEQTRVCFPLASYSGNLANELKKSRKYYLYDPGIRNILLNDFSDITDRADK